MKKSLDSIVKEFRDNVLAQSEAIERGDSKVGNRHAKRYIAAFEALRKRGDGGRDALAVLLDDESADVRTMAAAFLLRHCGERAVAVLERESSAGGLIGFEAKQTLKHWKDGTWALDPP
jgi:hypothetical protein